MKEKILYKHIEFLISQLRLIIHSIVTKTKKELFRDLLLLKINKESELITQNEEKLSEIR